MRTRLHFSTPSPPLNCYVTIPQQCSLSEPSERAFLSALGLAAWSRLRIACGKLDVARSCRNPLCLEGVSGLNGVHELTFKGCKHVTDASALTNVHTLDLAETEVRDVSALSNIHTLDLTKTKVRDVSALTNVHTLKLYHTKVTDVSALTNVHTLDLSCTKVTDVSMLIRAHTLNLFNCQEVTDVSALTNVHTLHLEYTEVKDVSAVDKCTHPLPQRYRSDRFVSIDKRAQPQSPEVTDCQH